MFDYVSHIVVGSLPTILPSLRSIPNIFLGQKNMNIERLNIFTKFASFVVHC